MEQKTLSASARLELKKGASGRLRRAGKIPAVIYGHSGTEPIAIDAREFGKKFKRISENTIINLQLEKKAVDVLVKEFQEDILQGSITHIDFYEIERGKVLRTHIPVHTIGAAAGVREGGILEVLMHDIEVECLPKDIPEVIEIDIADLDIGSSLHLSDVSPPEGVKFLIPDDSVLATVTSPRAEIEEAVSEEELLEGEEGEAAEGEEGEEGGAEATDSEE